MAKLGQLRPSQTTTLHCDGGATLWVGGNLTNVYQPGSKMAERLWACASPIVPECPGGCKGHTVRDAPITEIDHIARVVTFGASGPPRIVFGGTPKP